MTGAKVYLRGGCSKSCTVYRRFYVFGKKSTFRKLSEINTGGILINCRRIPGNCSSFVEEADSTTRHAHWFIT